MGVSIFQFMSLCFMFCVFRNAPVSKLNEGIKYNSMLCFMYQLRMPTFLKLHDSSVIVFFCQRLLVSRALVNNSPVTYHRHFPLQLLPPPPPPMLPLHHRHHRRCPCQPCRCPCHIADVNRCRCHAADITATFPLPLLLPLPSPLSPTSPLPLPPSTATNVTTTFLLLLP